LGEVVAAASRRDNKIKALVGGRPKMLGVDEIGELPAMKTLPR
jgi:hypothetical protein